METVTTAMPTVPNLEKCILPRRGRIPTKEKHIMKNKSVKEKSLVTNKKLTFSQNAKKAAQINQLKCKRKSNGKKNGLNKQTGHVINHDTGQLTSEIVLDKKLTITPSLIENLDGFCAVADIIGGENDEENMTNESDDDIHIDIENDDDTDLNPLLVGRSTSPNSVYEKLLNEANFNDTKESKEKIDDLKLPSSQKIISNDNDAKTFLEWKTCESQTKLKEETKIDMKDDETEVNETIEDNTEPIGAKINSVSNEIETSSVKLEDRNVLKREDIMKQIDTQKVLGELFSRILVKEIQ